MTDTNDSSASTHRRRSSFAGQTLADIFGGRRASTNVGANNTTTSSASPTAPFPGPLGSVAAQAQRRMSIHQLGLPASPTQRRRESFSSANSGSVDESAVVEDEFGPSQQTPFGRRVSFGAKALKDVKTGGIGGGQGNGGTDRLHGRSSIAETGISASSAQRASVDGGKKTTPPHAIGRGEGYNWADSFRNRAERSASITSIGSSAAAANHTRAQSVATMEPPMPAPRPAPPAEMPRSRVPDHFQERILKGDFYMD
ncbi:hypothetical protein MBLNU457_6997t1 [Dothideomycetes sp. NU457]